MDPQSTEIIVSKIEQAIVAGQPIAEELLRQIQAVGYVQMAAGALALALIWGVTTLLARCAWVLRKQDEDYVVLAGFILCAGVLIGLIPIHVIYTGAWMVVAPLYYAVSMMAGGC